MATYYILPTGNDSTGTGTSGNPWATISKAVTASANGDTIHCLAGVYTWVSQSFSSSSRFIVGDGAATTIFDGAAANPVWNTISCDLTMTGLTFRNAVASAGGPCFKIGGTATVTGTNCIFTTLTGSGSWTIFSQDNGGGAVNTVTLTSCLIYACPMTTNAGIFTSNGTTSMSVVLTNVTHHTNQLAAVTTPVFANYGGTFAASLTNCVFQNDNGTPVNFTQSGGGTVTYSGANNDITTGYSSPPALSNQITGDPLFVDAANGNFNLRPSSPCIGAGTAI